MGKALEFIANDYFWYIYIINYLFIIIYIAEYNGGIRYKALGKALNYLKISMNYIAWKINFEIRISRGKGYSIADRNKRKDDISKAIIEARKHEDI